MRTPDITLNDARKELDSNERVYRVSDFLTQDEVKELHDNNKVKHITPKFDRVDAFVAEIISRFGYETYRAWKAEEISQDMMVRLLEAERSREAGIRLQLETLIVASCAGANRPNKSGQSPRSLKMAIKMLNDERKKVEVL